MKFLSKLPSLTALVGSRWFIGLAAAGIVGGGVWMYGSGQLQGYQRGYERAETAYKGQVEEAINTTVERRDAQWSSDLETVYADLNEQIERNKTTIENERLLRQQISELHSDLKSALGRLRESDLGECNLSPEFDSMFTSPEETGPTPGTASDRQP